MERNVRKKKVRGEFDGLSREEKKQIVLREGTETYYLTCPLCAMNRTLKKYVSGQVRFTDTNLDEFKVLVTRVGGGLGSGFFRDDSKCWTLVQMKENPEYQEILDQIREQCKRILAILE